MKLPHFFTLLLVAVIWGFNFVPIRIGLNHVSPLTFTALRFLFTVFPAIFLIKRPQVPYRQLAAYGLLMFAGQFACMFMGIYSGMSAGLASLVVQVQAFFTIGFAALVLKERPLAYQIVGALVAAGGIALVGAHVGGEATAAGIIFVVLAAASWSAGNLLTKTFTGQNMFGVIVWGNLFACLFMLPFAFIMEGPRAMLDGVKQLHGETLLSLCYIAYCSTFIGYTLWSRKLSIYSAAAVAPFALMVPAFAMLSAVLFLGETFPFWKFEATLLIMGGLCVNQFGGKALSMFKAPAEPA